MDSCRLRCFRRCLLRPERRASECFPPIDPERPQHLTRTVESYNINSRSAVAPDFVLVDEAGIGRCDGKVFAVPKERRAGVAGEGWTQRNRVHRFATVGKLKEDGAIAAAATVINSVGKKIAVAVVRAVPEVDHVGIPVVVRRTLGVAVNCDAA